jgi:plasmid stabilization system protein ParE
VKVVLADEALRELEEIGDYIARDNPERARTFVAELLGMAGRLGERPEAFPVLPRYAHLGIRRRVHGAYLIFYRLETEQVTIIHILHGARDYDALLFPD